MTMVQITVGLQHELVYVRFPKGTIVTKTMNILCNIQAHIEDKGHTEVLSNMNISKSLSCLIR